MYWSYDIGRELVDKPSSKTIFPKEVENIIQALTNNGFPNYIVDEQIKRMIKNVNE